MSVTLNPACEDDLEDLRDMVGWYTVEIAKHYPAGIKPPVMVADEWLCRSTPNVFMIYSGEQIAGFILIAVRPCIPGVMENYIGEFYIKPEFRHTMAARSAFGLLMKTMPGEWTSDVLALNDHSMRGTRAVARRYGRCMREVTIFTDVGEMRRFRWKAV